MDNNGNIRGSDLENPLSWPALNSIKANQEADKPVALAKQLQYAVAFCENSTQLFYDAANATGSPLLPYTSGFSRIGCASAGSVATTTGTLFWMGKTNQKGRSVYYFDGLSPSVLSNSYIDRILNADDLATVYSYCIRIAGHLFYVLTLKTSNITLVCDIQNKEWFTWSWMTPQTAVNVSIAKSNLLAIVTQPAHGKLDGDVVLIAGANQLEYNGRQTINVIDANTYSYAISSNASAIATGNVTSTGYTEGYMPFSQYAFLPTLDLLAGELDGIIYKMDENYYDDNGNPIRFKIRTNKSDFGTNKTKFISKTQIIGNKISSTGFLRYTDDDYQTWSVFRPINMNSNRSQLNRGGSFRRRAHEFQDVDSVPIRLEAIEVDVTEGTT
jgi:hypothetical protein